tara:strand:- start:19988 stop:20350 length:363 start_codon:yes stop_codon:yes gene_type:complete
MEPEKTFNSVDPSRVYKDKANYTSRTWTTADEVDFLHSVLIHRSTKILVPDLIFLKRYLGSMNSRQWPENMSKNVIEKEAIWLLQLLKMDMLNERSARFSPFYANGKYQAQRGWTLKDLR